MIQPKTYWVIMMDDSQFFTQYNEYPKWYATTYEVFDAIKFSTREELIKYCPKPVMKEILKGNFNIAEVKSDVRLDGHDWNYNYTLDDFYKNVT